ncbi:MAG: rRNA maturation RNase YbeY [Patescibacteria group bacterium]|jgi:probable rRNA maturation factor
MSKANLDLVISGRLPSSMSSLGIKKTVLNVMKNLRINSAVLGIAFLTEAKIAEKNKIYRGKKSPTDVLSFETRTPNPESRKNTARMISGDVLICPTFAAKQAKLASVPIKEELNRLLIHGLLHLAGFDHADDAQEKRMFGLQERILKAL